MLNSKNIRTTISLPEDLLFEIKQKALFERKTLKSIIQEGLKVYLRGEKTVPDFKNTNKQDSTVDKLFGSWGKGERGVKFVRRLRNSKAAKKRDVYLEKLWKKSL